MRFELLGPLSITDAGESVVLQPSKPTILLAALLLHANSVVSVEYLQRTIWGDEQPVTAKAALQTCVLRLRRLFIKHGVTDTSIEAVPGGYRITATERTLDLIRFRERVRRAVGLSGDPVRELHTLKDALSLWQGSLLPNVRSQVMHRDEVPRLIEERLRTVERACDLELAMGRCGEALVELWSATRTYPGHEKFWEQLIEALYRTGRQTEALGEYRRIKEFLREELGVDPSPALQKLELAILRGQDLGAAEPGRAPVRLAAVPEPAPAPALAPASATSAPAPASATSALAPASGGSAATSGPVSGPVSDRAPTVVRARSAYTLPAVPSFTGRAAEVDSMVESLTRGGPEPVTLLVSGAPGIGKTALALHVAHRVRESFPGGRLLVRMVHPDGTPRTADEAAAEVSAALPAREPGARGAGEGRSGNRADRVLLLLDDVVDADQVRPLLPVGTEGATVITSRRGLAGLIATHGGWVHRLSTFDEQESHQLLLSVLGHERVEAEPESARRLAAACGHYPLALRIMAARLLTRPGLPLADGVEWMADDPLARLSLTDDPAMSVERVLDGALHRVEPWLAEAFLRLGTLGADKFYAERPPAEDGAAAPSRGALSATRGATRGGTRGGTRDDAPGGVPVAETERALERLAEAGLLEEGSPGPYRMHELLRVYARWATDRTRQRQKV